MQTAINTTWAIINLILCLGTWKVSTMTPGLFMGNDTDEFDESTKTSVIDWEMSARSMYITDLLETKLFETGSIKKSASIFWCRRSFVSMPIRCRFCCKKHLCKKVSSLYARSHHMSMVCTQIRIHLDYLYLRSYFCLYYNR